MNTPSFEKSSVIQRRSTIADLQAALDGLAVLTVSYFLITHHLGVLTAPYTVLVVLLLGALGFLYDVFAIYRKNTTFTRKAIDLLQAWTLAFCFLISIGFATKQSDIFSRLFLGQLYAGGYLVQVMLHAAMRIGLAEALKHAAEPHNALVVGTGPLAGYLTQRIQSNDWLGQRVVGLVALEGAPRNDRAAAFGVSAPVLGSSELMEVIDREHVKTVYFAIPLNASDILESVYFRLLDRHVAVHWVPDIFSLRLVNHAVSEIAGVPVLTLSETPLIGTRKLLKTAEDLVLSAVLVVLLAPVMAAIAVAVRLDSPGPVFFRQSRMGWGGKKFHIWKFRSMYVHEEGTVVQQAQKNDPRITRVGAILRRTSLDELPQIFNVLTGEMSLVGPRPHAVQHDFEYAQHIAHYFARHNIKPGITGLAQVRGFRGETREIEKMMLRVESDIEYINSWSLWLDLSILVRTFRAFSGQNAY